MREGVIRTLEKKIDLTKFGKNDIQDEDNEEDSLSGDEIPSPTLDISKRRKSNEADNLRS